MIKLLIPLIIFSIIGCASKQESKSPQVSFAQKEADDFESIKQLIEARKWSESEKASKWFQEKYPHSKLNLLNKFYLARALEGQDKCSIAIEHYRGIIQATLSTQGLQSQALYRASVCYEALDKPAESLAALNDVWSRRQLLTEPLKEAELPARLAAAYARLGQLDIAKAYFDRAENGLNKLQASSFNSSSRKSLNGWLAETLFEMGQIVESESNTPDSDISLQPLVRGQGFLIRTIEVNEEPWAQFAVQSLTRAYAKRWRKIESIDAAVSRADIIVKRERQKALWNYANLLNEALVDLEAVINKTKKNANFEDVLKAISTTRYKIVELLKTRPAGEGLTPEALSRRKGNAVIDPKPLPHELAPDPNM